MQDYEYIAVKALHEKLKEKIDASIFICTTKEDSLFVYKYNEKDDELMPYPFVKRKIDKEKSKTWVYLWGLETLDMENYFVGYDIHSFIKFILEYPEDMKIYFQNKNSIKNPFEAKLRLS